MNSPVTETLLFYYIINNILDTTYEITIKEDTRNNV